MSKSRSPFRDFTTRYPFGVLLGTLLVLIALCPILSRAKELTPGLHGQNALAPVTIVLTLIATSTVWVLAHSRRVMLILSSMIIASVVLGLFSLHHEFVILHFTFVVIFLGYLLYLVTSAVFRRKVVDSNVLCGAVCIYLLVGVLIGYVYVLLEVLSPGSFYMSDAGSFAPSEMLKDTPGLLVYFSLTTLTTAAFGDILPASDVARSLAMMEAVIGQITVVLIIGRLVGLHVAHATLRANEETKP